MCRPKEIELEQLFCWRDFLLGLDHVRQRPNDPDRRLVLADWLDDHGYYEIAELFRQSTTKLVGDVLTASR